MEVDLTPGGEGALAAATSARKFVDKSVRWKFPANVFVSVDAKVNVNTGTLAYPEDSLVGNMLGQALGQGLLDAMRRSSDAALNGACNPQEVWYDDAPFSRGGWRGLFLAASGSVVSYRRPFENLKSLVDR